jgi:hypothetical protein
MQPAGCVIDSIGESSACDVQEPLRKIVVVIWDGVQDIRGTRERLFVNDSREGAFSHRVRSYGSRHFRDERPNTARNAYLLKPRVLRLVRHCR